MARRMRTFFGQLEASGLGYMGKWIGVATLIGVATGLAAVGFDWLVELGRDHLVPRTTGVEGSGLGGGEGSLLGRTWPLLLLLPALWHRDEREGFALAHFLVVIGVVLSRYYATTWALLFLLAVPLRGPPERTPTAGIVAGAGLLLLAAVARAPGEHTGNYFLMNWLIYLLFAGLCVGYLISDLRAGRFRRGQKGAGNPSARAAQGSATSS